MRKGPAWCFGTGKCHINFTLNIIKNQTKAKKFYPEITLKTRCTASHSTLELKASKWGPTTKAQSSNEAWDFQGLRFTANPV